MKMQLNQADQPIRSFDGKVSTLGTGTDHLRNSA